MRRWLHRGLIVLPLRLSIAGTAAILRTSPFAAPLVERGAADLARTLERGMARTVTPDWLETRLTAALAAEDLDRADMLVETGADHGIAPTRSQQARIDALRARTGGAWAQAGRCGACMLDATQCDSVARIGLCLIPFELTPAGDVNALRRAGVAYATGRGVDRIDAALAGVGLAATAAILPTAGLSATAKAGATALRVARRAGTLTPAFADDISGLLRASRVGGDASATRRLTASATDLARIARATSPAAAVDLMRHVDTAADARLMATLAEAAGPRTPRIVDALGKRRAFASLLRLTDRAVAALLMIYATALQILLAAANLAGSWMMRALRTLTASPG